MRLSLPNYLTAEQQQALRDLDARADEMIIPDLLSSGHPATLRTAMALETDRLLFGACYTKIGARGLLERIPPSAIGIPPDKPDIG